MSPKSKTSGALSIEPRTFAQDRARRTYQALLEAAEEQFSARGFDATQTPDVAAAAGVSVGTFYRYFDDKKEIFLDVLKRYLTRERDAVMAGLQPQHFVGAARREMIAGALRVLIDVMRAGSGLHRTFLDMSLRDADVAALRDAFEGAVCEQMAELVAAVCPPDRVPDPTATAWVLMTSAVECAHRVTAPLGATVLDSERALAALTDVTCRALLGAHEE